MGIAEVLANPADGDRIASRHIRGHRKAVGGKILDQLHSWGHRQQLPGLLHGKRLLKFDIDGLGMGPQHRHPHTGRREAQVRQAKNLAGLMHHFQFFFAITVGL